MKIARRMPPEAQIHPMVDASHVHCAGALVQEQVQVTGLQVEATVLFILQLVWGGKRRRRRLF